MPTVLGNRIPLENRADPYHSNAEHVWYSSPHCKCWQNQKVIQEKIFLSFQSNMSPNLLDNYKYMAQENIGTTRPNFYISWAWELEQAGNFKGAEKVITVTI